jgi:hypothetical protein
MNFDEVMRLAKHQHGDKFVPPEITYHQLIYFNDGCRIEVTSPSGYVRRGHLGITTGYRPSLLLIPRRGASGSSDLINQTDAVTAWIDNRGRRHEIPNAWEQAMREHAV